MQSIAVVRAAAMVWQRCDVVRRVVLDAALAQRFAQRVQQCAASAISVLAAAMPQRCRKSQRSDAAMLCHTMLRRSRQCSCSRADAV
jgi:hypothetical protein